MTLINKVFSFKGRLRRRDYWLLSLALGLVIIAVMAPLFLGLKLDLQDKWVELLSLVFLWPSVALLVKRIHDRDKTGWMAANYWVPSVLSTGLSFIPEFGLGGLKVILDIITTVVGVWFLIEFGFMDGTQGRNAYGPSPKGVGGQSEEKLADVFA
jgi:uncharacterized membrane protein YhaH (DUF805 family)